VAEIIPFNGTTPLAMGLSVIREFQRIHELRKTDLEQAESDFAALLAKLREDRDRFGEPGR
jgi:hypothetical protein